MKNFLSFTLAAGVAITTTSLVHAASVPKAATNSQMSVSTRVAPATIGGMAILDRLSINRELARISDLLSSPIGDEFGLGDDAAVVTKKVSPSYTF